MTGCEQSQVCMQVQRGLDPLLCHIDPSRYLQHVLRTAGVGLRIQALTQTRHLSIQIEAAERTPDPRNSLRWACVMRSAACVLVSDDILRFTLLLIAGFSSLDWVDRHPTLGLCGPFPSWKPPAPKIWLRGTGTDFNVLDAHVEKLPSWALS